MSPTFSAVVVARDEEALIRDRTRELAAPLHNRDDQTIGDLVRKWEEYADKEARTQVREGGSLLGPLWIGPGRAS
jgi:hypothetical protein